MLTTLLSPATMVPVFPALAEPGYMNLHANDDLRLWADELEVPMELLMRAMIQVGSDMSRVTDWICSELA